jgi:hypothetical protein
MNNSEPSEYTPDKNPTLLPQLPNSNAWAFSVSWTGVPNAIGVKPPNPQFQPAPQISYILPQTIVDAPTENGKAPVGLIQSRREPYAVEWYPGEYGSLNSKLGTNMGA